MKKEMIVRVWKEPEFRASLSAEERAALPESPSGRSISELEERELDDAVGGVRQVTAQLTLVQCPSAYARCRTQDILCRTTTFGPRDPIDPLE
jgi:mersacidin/lichenicidin family type 2 lantibiotic